MAANLKILGICPKPYTTKYAGLGLRQPLLISVKTLPYKTYEIKQNKRKANTRNINPYSTQSQWSNKQNKKNAKGCHKTNTKIIVGGWKIMIATPVCFAF